MENPYILPLVFVALFLAAVKGQWQGLILAVVSPYVAENKTFIFILLVAMASYLYGRFTGGTSG